MLCAYTRPRYQVSVYRTNGPLVQAPVCFFYADARLFRLHRNKHRIDGNLRRS